MKYKLKNKIKKLIFSKNWKSLLFRSSLALTITSGLSYILGLIRDRVLTSAFGASRELDIYNAAFVIPDLILAIFVTSALSAAFVPLFTQCHQTSQKKAALYASQIINWLFLILFLISIIIAIVMPFISHYFVPGFSAEEQKLYIQMVHLLLLVPFLFMLSNTFGGMLLTAKRFFWYGLAPVLYNLGIIIGALFLVKQWGIKGLVLGACLGAFLHMLIRFLAILQEKNFSYKLNFRLSSEVRQTVRLAFPKVFQIGSWQVLLWWFVSLASRLEEGSVTVYSLARNFQSVPVSLIGIAIALVSFSELSRLASEKKYSDFRKLLRQKTILIATLTMGAAFFLALISYPLIRVLFGSQKFTEEAVMATAGLLAIYTLSIPLESLMHLWARAHYALKNTWRPSVIHIFSIFFIIISSVLLVKSIGLYSIPVSFAMGLLIQVGLLLLSYWQLIGFRLDQEIET